MPTTPDGIVFPDVNSTYPEANWWVAMANSISGKIASSEAGEQRAINAAVSAEAAAALAEAATDGIEEIRDETVQARDDAVAAVQSVDDALDQVNASAAAAEAAQQAAEDAASLINAPAGEVIDTYLGAIDGDLGHLYIPGAVSATPPPSPYVGQYWVDPADDDLLTPSVTEVASRWLAGSGHPEGVVAAALGTRYTDTAAVGGAIDWVKTTTAGSAGWKVAYGDTGWREMPGGTKVRRTGDAVYVQYYDNLPAGTGNVEPDILPVGFRPKWHSDDSYVQGTVIGRSHILTNGVVRLYGVVSSGLFTSFSDSYSTTDPWPTTLPGTAV